MQGRPGRIGDGVGVAVGGRHLDCGDRSPVVVVVLGLEGPDVAVRQGHVEQREQARVLPQVEPGAGGGRPGDPVPLQRRALDPEQRDLRLVGGARAGRGDAVAAQALDLVEVRGVALVGHRVRRPGTELGAVVEHERLGLAEPRAERERGTGREAVLAGSGALGVRRNPGPRSSVRRSVALRARIAAAAAFPRATPRVLAGPSRTAASAAT